MKSKKIYVSILACIVSMHVLAYTPTENKHRDTYYTPDSALARADKALLLISSKMNQGLIKIAGACAKVHDVEEFVVKHLKNTD